MATTELSFIQDAERWIDENLDGTVTVMAEPSHTFSFFPKEELDLKRQKQLLIQCVIPKLVQQGFRCRLMSVQQANYIDLTVEPSGYNTLESQSSCATMVDPATETVDDDGDDDDDDDVDENEDDEDDEDGSRTVTMNDIENDLALMEKEKDVLNLLVGSNATPESNDLVDLCFCADCRSARG